MQIGSGVLKMCTIRCSGPQLFALLCRLVAFFMNKYAVGMMLLGLFVDSYLRQGVYVFVVVYLSVSNFAQKLPNGFA